MGLSTHVSLQGYSVEFLAKEIRLSQCPRITTRHWHAKYQTTVLWTCCGASLSGFRPVFLLSPLPRIQPLLPKIKRVVPVPYHLAKRTLYFSWKKWLFFKFTLRRFRIHFLRIRIQFFFSSSFSKRIQIQLLSQCGSGSSLKTFVKNLMKSLL